MLAPFDKFECVIPFGRSLHGANEGAEQPLLPLWDAHCVKLDFPSLEFRCCSFHATPPRDTSQYRHTLVRVVKTFVRVCHKTHEEKSLDPASCQGVSPGGTKRGNLTRTKQESTTTRIRTL